MNENNTDWEVNIENILKSDTIQSDHYSLKNLKYFFSLQKETPQTLFFYIHYEILFEKYNSFVVICIKNQNEEKHYILETSFLIKSDGKSKIKIPLQLNQLLDQHNGWIQDNNSILVSISVKIESLINHSRQTFKVNDYNLKQYSIVDIFAITDIQKNIAQRISSCYKFGKNDEFQFYFEGKSNPEKKIQLDLYFTDLTIPETFSIYILFQNRYSKNSKMIYENVLFDSENLRHSFIFDITESDFNESNGWICHGIAQFQFKVANFEFSEFPEKSNFPFQSPNSQRGNMGQNNPINHSMFNIFDFNNPHNLLSRLNPIFPNGSPSIDHIHSNHSEPAFSNQNHDFSSQSSFPYDDDEISQNKSSTIPDLNQIYQPENNEKPISGINFNDLNDIHHFPNIHNLNNGLPDITSHFQANNDIKPIQDFDFNHLPENPGFNEDNNIIDSIGNDTCESEIGLAGLQNQGATCYLNSAIQLLFHIPAFRKIVYQIKIDENSHDKSDKIALSLQKLFISMQINNHSVCSTNDLTNSFGWNQTELVTEHDVQEFIRTLISNLEKKLIGTELEGEIAKIFRGRSCTVVSAPQVKYESVKNEFFYDLPLVVRGSANLEESLTNFLKPEELSGNNMYVIDGLGPQEAEMHTEFIEFPSVLQIHLKRFEYDFRSQMEIKINDRFEFPSSIDLSMFLNSKNNDKQSENIYDLYCILVHEGFAQLGHYYAFIREILSSENIDEKKNWKFNDDLNNWFKFNDAFVSKASYSEAVVNNYGGSFTNNSNNQPTMYGDKFFSAYMIVYVRRDKVVEIMKPISDDEIPQNLKDFTKQLKENTNNSSNFSFPNNLYQQSTPIHGRPRIIDNWDRFGDFNYGKKEEEKMEDASFMLEESYFANFTKDFYELKLKGKKLTMKISNKSSIDEIYKEAEKSLKLDEGTIRLWITTSDFKPYKPFYKIEFGSLPGNFFVQHKEKTDPIKLEKPFTITVFVIFFDISLEFPSQYIGSTLVKKNDPISAVFKFANEKLGFPENNEFLTYKEKGGPYPFELVDDDYQLREKAAFVVLQLKKDTQLSNMACKYKWKNKDDFINALSPIEPDKTKDEIPFYNLIEENRNKLSEASSYFFAIKRYIYIIVYMIKKPDIPRIRIKYSTAFSIPELTDFIAQKLQLKYNRSEDSILLFSNHYNSPNLTNNYLTTFKDVSIRKEYKYYIQEIKGMNFDTIQKAKTVRALIAFDGYNVSLQTNVYVEKDTQVFSVVSYLFEEKIFTDSIFNMEGNENATSNEEEDNEGDDLIKAMTWLDQGKIRIYQVNNHSVSQIWNSEDEIPTNTYEIKIDIVPDDQLQLTQTQILIIGSHNHNINNIVLPYLNPFFFVIDTEERVRDLKERLKKTIHLDESWDNCRIYLGNVELDASKDPIKIQYIYKSNFKLVIYHNTQQLM